MIRRFDYPTMPLSIGLLVMLGLAVFLTSPAVADTFSFSTGAPDGLIGTASRPGPGSGVTVQTETADDFVLTQATSINHATFTGLLPVGAPLTNITNVEIEFYHVFPNDSNVARTSGAPTFSTSQVPTRVNSPGDVEIASATRVSGLGGSLTFTQTILSPNFTVLNTVVNGINIGTPPTFSNVFTGGEGPVTGEEVAVNVTFTTPVVLPADHYFFRPEALLSSGNFLWLSAPRPIVPPGTPFPSGFTDLQSWIRNDNLAPDWLRIGTDITHQGPFNAAFSLDGNTVPEPSTLLLLGSGLAGVMAWRRKKSLSAK